MGISIGKFSLKKVPLSIIWSLHWQNCWKIGAMMINVAPIAARRLSVIHGQKMYSKFCTILFFKIPFGFSPQPEENYGFIDSQFFLQPRSCSAFVQAKYGCQSKSTFEGKSNNLQKSSIEEQYTHVFLMWYMSRGKLLPFDNWGFAIYIQHEITWLNIKCTKKERHC